MTCTGLILVCHAFLQLIFSAHLPARPPPPRRYADGVTYGELFLQGEYEMSVFNLDAADVEEQRARFSACEREAQRMLAARLPVPAYDLLLKCSHAFNVLDARGAVGVTERADCFARMRGLAREVTGARSDLVCGWYMHSTWMYECISTAHITCT